MKYKVQFSRGEVSLGLAVKHIAQAIARAGFEASAPKPGGEVFEVEADSPDDLWKIDGELRWGIKLASAEAA